MTSKNLNGDVTSIEVERLLMVTSDLCCVVGLDGRFLWVNRAWEECLGYPADELLQGSIVRFLHPDDRDRPGPGAPPRFESRFRHREGGERRLAWRSMSAGGLFYGAARVVTPSGTNGQEGDLAGRAKAEFLANMSHEIRTPLTAILGFTELVMERFQTATATATSVGNDPESLEHLRAVHRNGERLLALVSDVLDFTRLESGEAPVTLAACSPGQMVAEVVAALRPRATAKGLTLDVEHQTPLPVSLRTDASRLRQILIQVVGNALKFTERGGVRLAVRLEPGPAIGPRLVVEVSDTGIGMSADALTRLFQPFYRVDTSRRRAQGGAGLGLAISRRLADQLGGALDARSTPNLGSRFTLTLPAGPAETLPVVAVPIAEAMVTLPPLDARILVADDNLDTQRVVSIRLTMAGARVELAPNGRVALDKALAARDSGQPFDLVLMDMQMPVLDGYEATRLLRMEEIRAPIVALTAHATPEDRLECLHFGCDEHVSKPIDWAALLDLINRLLSSARAS